MFSPFILSDLWRAMVKGHTEVLSRPRRFSATTADPVLKAFAQKITPIIAMHLHHAKMGWPI
jgi:hypothetical protein